MHLELSGTSIFLFAPKVSFVSVWLYMVYIALKWGCDYRLMPSSWLLFLTQVVSVRLLLVIMTLGFMHLKSHDYCPALLEASPWWRATHGWLILGGCRGCSALCLSWWEQLGWQDGKASVGSNGHPWIGKEQQRQLKLGVCGEHRQTQKQKDFWIFFYADIKKIQQGCSSSSPKYCTQNTSKLKFLYSNGNTGKNTRILRKSRNFSWGIDPSYYPLN